ncbi:hypothetical protein LTR97_004115 [Elasticomyces elasticus]|uniref:F-box domain-containing protein n=1 Tax=Elasticomyces elasticus TaxID=574655 RepID=A0AAN7W9T0_9PEZI|nr:hypothetical protein LTR97_004115 [Elasticomyces elasticus]
MNFPACFALLFALLATTYANTEKAIFTAPPAINIETSGPSFEQLQLQVITPKDSSRRLSLPVAFPSGKQTKGVDAWYLLRDLSPDQRYEVRVCWAAVQPTNFVLDVFNTTHVFDTPDLIQDLAAYSESQQNQRSTIKPSTEQQASESILFLRVQAAADFFTSNKTLMSSPPSVDVELVLDPYLANVFPKSLLPTAIYIVILAGGGWFLSNEIWKRLFTGQPGTTEMTTPAVTTVATVPQHPFYTLPSELILDIIDLLPPESFITFAFANYPLLHSYGLAPALSRPRVVYITTQTSIPMLFPLLRLPPEIMLHVMRNLKPIDIMRFAVANYQDLERQGIAPPLSAEVVGSLRRAVGVGVPSEVGDALGR